MDDQTVTIEAPPQNGAEAVPASYADSVVADLAAVRARALSAIEHYEEQARGETERHNRRIAEINGAVGGDMVAASGAREGPKRSVRREAPRGVIAAGSIHASPTSAASAPGAEPQ